MDPFRLKFGYIQTLDRFFRPRTLNAALKAMKAGALPTEGFAWTMNSLKPVLEEPWDFRAFDRILASKELDFGSAKILMELFERMTGHPDFETALYAAESINFIESHYAKKIHQASALADGWMLARLYLKMAVLNASRPSIRRYYGLEALKASRPEPRRPLKLQDLLLRLAAYRVLEQPDRALSLLNQAEKAGVAHPRLTLARAQLAFEAGRAGEVARLMNLARSQGASGRYRKLIDFWNTGEQR